MLISQALRRLFTCFSARGNNRVHDACASFTINAKTPGTTSKVTVTYNEPSTGRVLKDSVHISAFRNLKVVYPNSQKNENLYEIPHIFLPVGSSSKVILQGGPTPWQSKPAAHFKQSKLISKYTQWSLAIRDHIGSHRDLKFWS